MSSARLKFVLILATVLDSGVVMLAWTQDWFSLTLLNAPDGGAALSVSGSVAAGALPALALAGLALTAALGLAGPVFRVILGVLELVLGASVVLAASIAIADPVVASAQLVSEVSGIAGPKSVAALVSSSTITAWPFVASAGGVLLVLCGLGVVITAARWPNSGRKYQAARFAPGETPKGAVGTDSVADWDGLTRGEDPTDQP